MLKPPALAAGDRIEVVSLSWGGPGAIPHRYEAGKRQLEQEFGLEVVESRHARAASEWLAANPQARAEDLMEAFGDTSVRGIISSIGGEDSIRILPFLDPAVIRRNPKVFLGYSDSTVAHFACFHAGLVSFYGPSIMAGFAENGGLFPYMVQAVRRTLFSAEPAGIIEPNSSGWTAAYLDWSDPANQSRRRALHPAAGWRWLQGEGTVRGPLLGGCLEVVDWLRGSPVWPPAEAWHGAILFFELSEENPPPAAVVRILRALAAAGVFGRPAAVLFGRPACGEGQFGAYDDALQQVLTRELGLDRVPIVTRMDFGHTDPMFVLPYGVAAEVDCEARRFAVVEAACACWS